MTFKQNPKLKVQHMENLIQTTESLLQTHKT